MKTIKLNGIKIHDSSFKFMIELDPQGFLNRFNIPYTFKKFLPTENVLKIDSQYNMDCLILTEEGVIVNIEFQSTYPNSKKQEIIKEYATRTYEKYGKEVITFIITIPPVEKEVKCNTLKCNIYHKVFEKSCKDQNGKELLSNIKHKIKNNKNLTNTDKQDLILSCYSSSNVDLSAELLIESMNIAHKIKTNKIEKYEREKGRIKYILIRLCERIVKDDRCKKVKEIGKMENSIFEELKQEGLEQGMKKGMKKIATNMKLKNYPTDEIIDLTGLSKEQISKL